MRDLFSYIQYSKAELQWNLGYAVVFLFLGIVFVALWIGYRNNQISDNQKRKAKIAGVKEKKKRLEKIASLYPEKK